MELSDVQRKDLHDHLDRMIEEMEGPWDWFELELSGMEQDYSAEHVCYELLVNSEGKLVEESGFRATTDDFRDPESWVGAS